MRPGWIRFRWPTRSAAPPPSEIRCWSAASLPAIQEKGIFSVLSRISSWMVSMFRGRGARASQDQVVDFPRVRGLCQGLSDAGVGHQAGDAGQQVQVGLGGGFRNQQEEQQAGGTADRKSTRLNSSHVKISYAVFCLKKKNQ